jgi:hypothetical protein
LKDFLVIDEILRYDLSGGRRWRSMKTAMLKSGQILNLVLADAD